MRGNKRYSRHTTPRPRYRSVVFLLSLALVVSQSMGIIAAHALDPSKFSAWGFSSAAADWRDSRDRTGTFVSDTTKVGTTDRQTAVSDRTESTEALLAPDPTGSFSVDFAAATPGTYDRTTGTGGAYKDGSNANVVEELEASGFDCGDFVVFFAAIEANGDVNSGTTLTLDFTFASQTTSNDLVGYIDLVDGSVNSDSPNSPDSWNSGLDGDEDATITFETHGTDAVTATIEIANLDPDEQYSLRLVAELGCQPDPTIAGNVHARFDDGSGSDGSRVSGGAQTVPLKQAGRIGQPGLTITKAASSQSVTFGASFSYTITVTNTGNAQATGVTVTDNLADSLTNVSASFDVDPGTSDGTGNCDIGAGNTVTCPGSGQGSITLAASDGNTTGAKPDVVVVTINATAPNTCGELTNTATVDSDQTSPQTSNQVTVTVTGCAPNLTITKQAQDLQGEPITSIPLGGTFNYVITVTNTGNASASPVIVTDNLNDSLTVNSATWDKNPPDVGTDGTCTVVTSGNTVTCPSTGTITLAASDGAENGDDTLRVVINVTVPENLSSCPTLANSAQVRIGEGTPSTAQSAPVTVTGCAPNLTITKSGPASVGQGVTITYTVTVTNSGKAAANGVIVTDNLNDSLTNVSASFDSGESICDVGNNPSNSSDKNFVTCNIGTVGAGSSVIITITANAPVGVCPTITNQASFVTLRGEGPGGSSNIVTTTVTGCIPPPPPPPSPIGINIDKGGPALAHVGDTVTYTFAVTLTTSTPLSNITVTDPICSATPTLVSKTGGDQDTTLEPGETWNFSCTHVVSASDPDPLPNTATVTGTAPDGRNTSDTDSHVVDIIHPAIRIVKTARPDSVGPGETVTYTYRVTNTGDVTLFDVKVTDNKLGDICTIPQLDVGQTETCTATFRVPDRAGPVDNVGVTEGEDVTGFSVRDQDNASVDVVLGTTVTPPPTTTPPSGVAFTGTTGVIPLAGLALLLLFAGSGILFVTWRREDGSET